MPTNIMLNTKARSAALAGGIFQCRIRQIGVLFVVCFSYLLLVGSASANGLPGLPGNEPELPSSPLPEDEDQRCPGNPGTQCELTTQDVGSSPSGNLPDSNIGNPINLMSGDKFQSETDFNLPNAEIMFRRMYSTSRVDANIGIGRGWRHSYAVSLLAISNGNREITQSNGGIITFEPDGADENGDALFRSSQPNHGYLVQNKNEHHWHLVDERVLTFLGKYLVKIEWPDQRELRLFYKNGRLSTVTDESSRILEFHYTPYSKGGLEKYSEESVTTFSGHLEKVTLPDGSQLQFTYDNNRNVAQVLYGNGSSRQYHYENEIYVNHLTGITDRNGVRFSTWVYDDFGRGVVSEHAGGVERVSIEYPDVAAANKGEVVTTIVTNSVGNKSYFNWQQSGGHAQPLLISSSGPGCATCPPTGYNYSYDSVGRLLSAFKTGQGNATGIGGLSYQYDEFGRIAAIHSTNSSGAKELVQAREYGSHKVVPNKIITPSVNPNGESVIETIRDPDSSSISVIERGFAPWVPLPGEPDYSTPDRPVSSYVALERKTTYQFGAEGHLISIDGPRDDVNDVTTFKWDTLNRLVAIAVPEQPVLHLRDFDTNGRATSVQFGTAAPVEMQYGEDGNISQIKRRGWFVDIKRDDEGRVTQYVDLHGNSVNHQYDDAGRMVSIDDSYGRLAQWIYDLEGKAINKSVYGIDGDLLHSLNQHFDAFGRLVRQSHSSQNVDKRYHVENTRHLKRDNTGRIQSIIDEHLGSSVSIERDEINRVINLVQPGGASTQYAFDALNNRVSVTDTNGNRIQQIRDDFGSVVGIVNPDTGVERLVRNAAGNVTERVREDSGVTRYTRDITGRAIKRIGSNGEVSTWHFNSDTGRLAEMESQGYVERFSYDDNRDLVSHQRIFDGFTLETHFSYNALGLLNQKTLPDGQVLLYEYHQSGPSAGTVKHIRLKNNTENALQDLVTEIDTEWRDGAGGWIAHNGFATQISYAPRGDILTIDVSGLEQLNYQFDHRDRIAEILDYAHVKKFNYEGKRLSGAATPLGNYNFTYDSVGNRVSEVITTTAGTSSTVSHIFATNEVPGSGNRLLSSTNTETGDSIAREYSAGGSLLNDGFRQYEYNGERRTTKVTQNGRLLASYQYNASGERISKTVYASDNTVSKTYFLYDNSRLAAEVDANGSVLRQYIYLEGHQPVALLQGQSVFAIHTDHLGTPHKVTNSNAEIVWAANYEPFGYAHVVVQTIEMPLRFPGQYFDKETGNHYNYFRDYDPKTGRYLTADPVGLRGGLHHYAYVDSDPLKYIDVHGLNRRPRNYREPTTNQLLNGLGARQLIETIRAREPNFQYPVHAQRNWFYSEQDVVNLHYIAQAYQLRDAIRNFDPMFDGWSLDFSRIREVQQLENRLDALTYIEQLRQTYDPDFVYPIEGEYTDADVAALRALAEANANQCTAFYDQDFSDYYNLAALENSISDGIANGELGIDEFGDWYDPEVRYQEYRNSGGRMSYSRWNGNDRPVNVFVERLSISDGAARQRLDRELGGVPLDGLAAHHVIPLQARTRFPDLMRLAAIGGYDINGANSGRLLGPAEHVGNHPGYSADVLAELALIDLNQSPADIAAEVQAIADDWIYKIDNGIDGPWR